MRRLVIAAVAIGCVVTMLWYLLGGAGRRGGDPASAAAAGSAAAAASSAGRDDSQAAPLRKVTRLASAEERRRFAERIAAARAARQRAAAEAAVAAQDAGRGEIALGQLDTSLEDALEEAIPFLADCYDAASASQTRRDRGKGALDQVLRVGPRPAAPSPDMEVVTGPAGSAGSAAGSGSPQRTAAVRMSLIGDPDVGTLIDAGTMLDREGRPLDPKLDDCLRSTLASLALPPLPEGDTLKLQYSFVFD